MDFRRFLFDYFTGIKLPDQSAIASTPVESIAAEDIEVEIYTTLFLDVQGKLQSLQEILDDLEDVTT